VNKELEDGERGEREGKDDRIHNSLAEHAGRLPGVELREPRNLCV